VLLYLFYLRKVFLEGTSKKFDGFFTLRRIPECSLHQVTKSSFDLEVGGQALAKPKLHRFLKKEYRNKGTVSVLTQTFQYEHSRLIGIEHSRLTVCLCIADLDQVSEIRDPVLFGPLYPDLGPGTSFLLIPNPGSRILDRGSPTNISENFVTFFWVKNN
jgi:hypothetical protein